MQTKNENNTSATLSDEQIVALYWDRDEKAIKETDKKYNRYLYTVKTTLI